VKFPELLTANASALSFQYVNTIEKYVFVAHTLIISGSASSEVTVSTLLQSSYVKNTTPFLLPSELPVALSRSN
jgi:hypothetical protein